MSDDDPLVSRTIRAAGTTITLNGELSHVDTLYRLITKSMLDTGRYTIPAPGDNPWQEYESSTPVHSPDFLRRRNEELERQLADATNRGTLQTLRHENHILNLQNSEWAQAIIDQAQIIESAAKSLRDDPNPNLYTHVALSFLDE